jgi:hypothetical protein
MRSLHWFLAVGVVAVVLGLGTAGPASAQVYGLPRPPIVAGWNYNPPYYWSVQHYANPWAQGWYYQAYNPWTNQYFHWYQTYPSRAFPALAGW